MASANLLVPASVPASADTVLVVSLPSSSLMPLILTTFFRSLLPPWSLVPPSSGRSSSPLLLDRALVLRSSLPLPLPPPLPLIPPLLPPPLSNDLPDVEVVVAPESPPTDAVTTAGLPLDVDAPPRSLVLAVPVVELAELDASPSSLPVEEDDRPPAPALADELPESEPEPEVLVLVVAAKRGRLFEAEVGAGAAEAEAGLVGPATAAGWSTSILLVESPSGLMTGNARSSSEDASPSVAAAAWSPVRFLLVPPRRFAAAAAAAAPSDVCGIDFSILALCSIQ